MAEIETLGILDEIQSIVSDKLQVVSYKWLSRNFSVSSNVAKSLLEGFVEKYGNGIEVIYSLSGWLKNNPSTYHISLVSKHKLSDAKQEFDGNCSVQVYSVQACLPKDPATLWNHEFVQAEDLSKQPLIVDNCLRNNMFCGVSNSFVSRNVGGTPLGTSALQEKSTGVSELSKSNSSRQNIAVPQPQQKKVNQPNPNAGAQSLDIAKNVTTASHVKTNQEPRAQLAPVKEKVPHFSDKKKAISDKNSSGAGNALASMWGRASTKPKPDPPLEQANNSLQKSAASAEAQISACEAVENGSSDEDGQEFKLKRSDSSRKRRVVFDYSDEEDEYQDVVSLASPEPPKQSKFGSKKGSDVSGLEINSNTIEETKNRPDIKEAKMSFVEEVAEITKGKKPESRIPEKKTSPVPVIDDSMKSKLVDAGSNKRKKVLKTLIDERGREVTEVVWEDEEPVTKPDNSSAKKAENNTMSNVINRPPIVKKSPAVGNNAPANQTGKGGNKKVTKDPKQGNILSFFKKT